MDYTILSTEEALKEIKPLLIKNKLAIFAGSGISVPSPSNLPSWTKLANEFVDYCRIQMTYYPDVFTKSLIADAKSDYTRFPIKVISALREEIENENSKQLESDFRQWFMDLFKTKDYNSLHTAIVETDYSQIVTTNYDYLFEHAAKDIGFRLKSFASNDTDQIAAAIYGEETAITHIHGIWHKLGTEPIIITSDDYQAIMRDKPGFRCVLQNIFIKYSLLIVGYGCNDPHFQDFMEELNHNLQWRDTPETPKYYVVLKKDKVDSIIQHHHARLSTKIVQVDDYDEILPFLEELKNTHQRQLPPIRV